MHRHRRLAAFAALTLAAAAAIAGPAIAQPPDAAPTPDDVVAPDVRSILDDGKPVRVIVEASRVPAVVEGFGVDGLYRGELTADQVDALAKTPGVARVELDLPLQLAGAAQNAHVDADELHASGWDGTGRTVAVIDSGVDKTHPALASRIAGEACFALDSSCPNGQPSMVGVGAGVPCTYTPQPSRCAHGTAVAGLAASTEAGTYRGAAPAAGVYSVRVIANSTGEAFTSDVIAALNHVRTLGGITAANLSLGGGAPTSAPCDGGSLAQAVGLAADAGITVVAAAGNTGSTTGVQTPGCVTRAFTVGGVAGGPGQSDAIAAGSNMGPLVDVVAPYDTATTLQGGGYGTFSGTSAAAPVVAALTADIAEARPASTAPQRERALLESGILATDQRAAAGGYARYRVSGAEALTRLDTMTADWWQNTAAPPSGIQGAPDVASWGVNRLDVVARGNDNVLYHRAIEGTGSWTGWAAIPGGVGTSDPTVVSWEPGRLDVLARGADNAIWHNAYLGGIWHGWSSIGGVATSEPDVSSWGPGRLDVFVRGTDGGMHHKPYANGQWHPWAPLGGGLGSGPGAAAPEFNRIYTFVQGTDGQLHYRYWDGSAWQGWAPLGGGLAGSPDASAVTLNPGRVDVAVRGTDGRLHYRRYTAFWEPWQTAEGSLAAGPTVASWNWERHAVNFLANATGGGVRQRTAAP